MTIWTDFLLVVAYIRSRINHPSGYRLRCVNITLCWFAILAAGPYYQGAGHGTQPWWNVALLGYLLAVMAVACFRFWKLDLHPDYLWVKGRA